MKIVLTSQPKSAIFKYKSVLFITPRGPQRVSNKLTKPVNPEFLKKFPRLEKYCGRDRMGPYGPSGHERVKRMQSIFKSKICQYSI